MPLKNLLPFSGNKKELPLPFYAIELSDEMAKVAVWQADEGVISVIRTSEVIQVTGSKMDDYLQAVDMAIATVSQDDEPDPKEVLYGLPPEWVDENGVVAQRRSLLKYISEKMVLKPMGFVMVLDALIEYLRAQQSTPPSAVFVRFRKQFLDICLVTLGKMVKLETVGRSNDVVADVKEGLVRLKSKAQLPPRIILFDGYLDFEDIKQQLMAVTWEKELPFAHTPVIESLSRDSTVEAVAMAAGKEATKTSPSEDGTAITGESVQPMQPGPVPVAAVTEGASQPLPEGFSVGLTAASQAVPVIATAATTPPAVIAPSLDGELNLTDSHNEIVDTVNTDPEIFDETSATESSQRSSIRSKLAGLFSSIKLSPLFKRSPDVPQLDSQGAEEEELTDGVGVDGRRLPWWSWIVGVVLLLLLMSSGAIWAINTIPTAEIRLGIRSQPVEQEVSFTISTGITEPDEQNLILPAKVVEASASGTQTVPTTGTKRIGKAAQGKVTVYNKTDKPKNFTKGTVLVGPGNLRYELAADVKIASRSAISTGEGQTVTFGKEDVSIAAGDIGKEYNQEAGKEFKFKDFGSDDFSAKNSEAISGGESSEVKSVAKEDRTNAQELLTQSLEVQATQMLSQQLGSSLVVVDKTQQSDLSGVKFDKKTGEEASELRIDGSINMSALAVDKNSFDRILLKALAAQIPQAYQPTSQGMQHQITEITEIEEDTKSSKNKVTKGATRKVGLKVKATVKIIPRLDFDQIKQAIRGKTPKVADEYLKTLPSFNGSQISVHPNLPGPFGTLPKQTEKIGIMVDEVQ